VLPHWGVSLATGHSLGAGVSAVRQFRGLTRTLGFAALAVALNGTARAADDCRLVTIGTANVRAATEATITLEDGRIVRLAGIEHANSIELPRGTTLTLKRLSAAPETDRYGRLNAHVFITENGTERWFQADLVGRGIARVSARVGDPACARELLGHEQTARAAKLGLWGEPVYVIGKAEDPAGVLESRGRLALVEGKVLSVARAAARSM
jgi:hypothetical protein